MKSISYTGDMNPNYRHGGNTINRNEYNSWRAMIARCYETKYRRYDRYGGRGIKVCDRWNRSTKDGFKNFLSDMGKKPNKTYSIERINNDGDYEPSNCRWATQTEQIHNSTAVKVETIEGLTATRSHHIKQSNKSVSLVYKLMKNGMTFEQAILAPNNGNEIARERRAVKSRERIAMYSNDCLACGNRTRPHKMFCSVICSNKKRKLQ